MRFTLSVATFFPGTTLLLLLAACGGGGDAAGSAALSPPHAPGALVLEPAREAATLSWGAVDRAEGYAVYLAPVSGLPLEDLETSSEVRRAVVAADVTSVPFDALLAGATYHACVRALGAAGPSPLSDEVSALLPPAAPDGLDATPGDASVTLSWSESPAATSYDVYGAADPRLDSDTWASRTAGCHWSGVTSPFTATGLANDVEHAFVVVAANSGGTSPDSARIVATPAAPPAPAPLAVEQLVATPGPGEVTLTWSDAGDGVTYVLYVATDPSIGPENWRTIEGAQRIEGVTSPYTLTGLKPGTQVYFVVTPMRGGEEGGASPRAAATPNARGTFVRGDVLKVGRGPSDLVAADLDGDGDLDLATANFADGTVSLLSGLGNGHLEPRGDLTVGDRVRSLAAGDFDRDGTLDLVAVLDDDATMLVLEGDGAFGFEATGRHDVVAGPHRVAALDADGDGRLDVAVLGSTDGEVAVLAGDGSGGFSVRDVLGTGSLPEGFAFGDLDGDSVLDVVVANSGDDTLSVALGSSDAFGSPETAATRSKPVDVLLGDFDDDGSLDAVVADLAGGVVECFLGNGDGTFAAGTSVEAGSQPGACVAADFDGDGRLDLAVSDSGGSSVSVLRGDGAGGFTLRQTVDGLPSGPRTMVVGDFDGDGLLDLAVASVVDSFVTLLLGDS